MSSKTFVAILLVTVLVGAICYVAGYYYASQTGVTVQRESNVVSIEVVPDFGGATYDAFVVSNNVSGNIPRAGSNASPDNSITVPVGVPVSFVITSIDSAVNMNFSGRVTVPFAIYSDLQNGTVALNYRDGESISNLAVGHTFTIDSLGISIPIPPMTIVSFNYTFDQPGSFFYHCTIPCGLGMGLMGYMQGFIFAKSVPLNSDAAFTSLSIQLRGSATTIMNLPSVYLFQIFLLIAVSIVGAASTEKSHSQ